jgi:protein associated with RNAse G/E
VGEWLTMPGIGWLYLIVVLGGIIIGSFIKMYVNRKWKLFYTAFGQENYFKIVSKLKANGVNYKVEIPSRFNFNRSFNDNTQYDIYVKKEDVYRASQK